MASKALKGLTIKIGGDTSELTKSLEKVEKQGKSLSSELGQINKLLKLDPKNTELLAQKQKVLADAISNTESKLDTLREAEKQVQAQFERGEVSEEQVRALQREIIATEKKLDGYKNAAKETADSVEELGKESREAGDEIEKQGKATEEAEEASEGLDGAAADLATGGLAAMATAAAAAVTAIVALAEESREYRTEMAKLDTAFTDNSFSAEAATKTYEDLQSILGETDQAVEAANNLAALCTEEEELNDWTEILTGVYGKFGASLPVEGLAEAANETKRVGQVTGPLADALNWAAAEGETFGVKMKKATKANEEWNKAVEEAASAEDYFNLALQECSSEQERQQLITKTLTKLYGSAAQQYKKTNKEVIRANQATEKWNKATAKIGKTVEPVVTDIKELGVSILEDAGEPLEDIAEYIQSDVLPALKQAGTWVKQNGPVIKGTLVGITTALIAFKTASIATEVAQKGLKGAIMATTVAQKALALAQAATPWGLAATAVAGVTAAVIALSRASEDAKQPADILTQEERELMAAADEAAQAFRDQKAATEEALGDVTAQMGHTQKLADELRGLADASGKVKEKDQERVQFILNELNQALGTEYSLVDGVIQKYGELEQSIDQVIKAKLADALLETANADYIAAVQAKDEALGRVIASEKEYQAQKEKTAEAEAAYAEHKELMNQRALDGTYATNWELSEYDNWLLAQLEASKDTQLGYLTEKESEYKKFAGLYGEHVDTINTFEMAQEAVLAGNTQTAIDLLSKKGGAYVEYSDKVDEETARVLDRLYQEAIDAGLNAQFIKSQFEKGADGIGEEMVKDAETNYNKAMSEFENAYADAEGVGEDMTAGMTKGAENKRSSLLSKARSLVAGFLSAARKEADSHSPSRKAIAIFEDIGEGAEIGVENKTADVAKAGSDQAAAVLDAYREQEVNAQRALRNVAEQQTARQASGQMTAANANSGVLEAILAAIEKGQVLTIDGETLVGATAAKMDNALGSRRALSARGAI